MASRTITRGMGAVAAIAAVLGLISIAGTSSAAGHAQIAQEKADAASPAPSSLPACIGVSTEARYVPYGYNHIVVLKSGCSKAATCSVSTNVNAQAISVEVASNASVEVLTFAVSPSQTFTARVTCTLH